VLFFQQCRPSALRLPELTEQLEAKREATFFFAFLPPFLADFFAFLAFLAMIRSPEKRG
jgi:hypothetical protein